MSMRRMKGEGREGKRQEERERVTVRKGVLQMESEEKEEKVKDNDRAAPRGRSAMKKTFIQLLTKNRKHHC